LTPEQQDTQLMTCSGSPTAAAAVCGCNGRTVRECQRPIYQISLFSTGACSAATCAGPSDCRPEEFCEFATGTCNGEGTCQPGGPAATSVRCTPDSGANCGCDGKTYRNECERRQVGVSKLREGPCR
jgi:hypothetical protein